MTPEPKTWITEIFEFIFAAPSDSFPIIAKEPAAKYAPTRFLLVLMYLMARYNMNYKKNFRKCQRNRSVALKETLELIIKDSKSSSDNNQLGINLKALKKDNSTIEKVKTKIRTFVNPIDNKGSGGLGGFLMMDCLTKIFPFFLFFDDVDGLNSLRGSGGISGIDIIRRGLDLDTRLKVTKTLKKTYTILQSHRIPQMKMRIIVVLLRIKNLV